MTDIIVKIMVEVLNIFAIATKEMKQGRAKRYFKKLVGRKDIENALKKLDKMTQEEARMAAAQILRLAHSVEDTVKVVDEKVTGIRDTMKDVDDKMGIDLNDGKDAKAVLQQTSSIVPRFCSYYWSMARIRTLGIAIAEPHCIMCRHRCLTARGSCWRMARTLMQRTTRAGPHFKLRWKADKPK